MLDQTFIKNHPMGPKGPLDDTDHDSIITFNLTMAKSTVVGRFQTDEMSKCAKFIL